MVKKNNDNSKLSPILVAIFISAVAIAYGALYWWVFQMTVQEGQPMYGILILSAIPIFVIVGVVIAVHQRLKEIDRGELDEAKKY